TMGIVAFALGLIVGSFVNVCIYRLPRRESVVWPGSHCPHCQAPIRWYDNIPLLSFALLGGRCRRCRAPISWRYPLVEFLTAALFVQSVAAFGVSLRALQSLVLGTLLLIVFFVDLDHYIIPNRITYPGTVIGLLFAALSDGRVDWRHAAVAAVTALALGGGFVLVNVLSAWILGQEGMGMGDAKLAAMIGAFLGWPIGAVAILMGDAKLAAMIGAFLDWPIGAVAILMGVFIGGALGVGLLALRLKGRREQIPFGPAMAAGALAAMWWGPGLLNWYLTKMLG